MKAIIAEIHTMLTPMLVQYLVGLCCLRWDQEVIDVTLGDMVLDSAAGKERDVDVTVTVAESPNIIRAFKAYEVKREKDPLDVTIVEQLSLKLLDMPKVTHRAIVSASGFTRGAEKKAAHHGVELYTIKPWTRPIQEQFPNLNMQGVPQVSFKASQVLLIWTQYSFRVDTFPAVDATVQSRDRLFGQNSKPHHHYATLEAYNQELLLRSTEMLVPLQSAATISIGSSWPYSHTLNTAEDEVYIDVADKLVRIESVTIEGLLLWEKAEDPEYYVIESVPGGETFAGAIIAAGVREGSMWGCPDLTDSGLGFKRKEPHEEDTSRWCAT